LKTVGAGGLVDAWRLDLLRVALHFGGHAVEIVGASHERDAIERLA
jgi:hypothetical protein